MKLLVTGSTGFIGQQLVQNLLEQTDVTLHLAVKKSVNRDVRHKTYKERVVLNQIDHISYDTQWHQALMDCQVVIHAAARVHVMNETAKDPLMAFREVNVEGTLNLARQAAQAGVRRFIFISSIKVNGEYTQPDKPFTPEDLVMPEHPYAISKYEAEQGLMKLAEKSQMEVVIIRPPLVYGPRVNGNFLRMMQLLQKGILLPFGALSTNRRSFVSLDNLINLITICIVNPRAANQIFLVSDDNDLSTTHLFQKIQQILDVYTPLLPVPSCILKSVAMLLGKKAEMMRICGSLQVDISKSRQLLNWQPPESLDNALYNTVQDYIYTYST